MDENILRQLFPWPADRPIRKPRFGKAPLPSPEPLPDRHLAHEDEAAPRSRFTKHWQDDDLGIRVTVLVQDTGEVWAYVAGNKPEHSGKAVSVALVVKPDGPMRRITVPLDTPEQDGWSGAACLGSLEESRPTW